VDDMTETRIQASADVDGRAVLGAGCSVWHLAQVREDAVLGRGCIIGRGAYIGSGVTLGDHVKVQNYALVYEPATLGDGVFIGPAAVLTNDLYPRAVTVDGQLKAGEDWVAQGVRVGEGASIGARAVVLGGVTVGPWALVAAGAVVSRDVAAYSCVAGVPARHRGWVGRSGKPLRQDADGWLCPDTGERYVLDEGVLTRVG
jgi:UDP-2-acetamido-3-amino-2,3-dideoxy-glucuronate N-acetyltransferase